jgi:hypothetical protein
MKLIARMHQCPEASGNQSISSSTGANGRGTNLHSVAIDGTEMGAKERLDEKGRKKRPG